MKLLVKIYLVTMVILLSTVVALEVYIYNLPNMAVGYSLFDQQLALDRAHQKAKQKASCPGELIEQALITNSYSAIISFECKE